MTDTKETDATKKDYTPKNILLTGGCGFIGSNVLLLLVNKYPQYNFVNYDCLDSCATLNNVKDIQNAPNYKFVKGNILSSDLVNYVIKTNNIDTIMHFAAQSHVDNSFGNSFIFTETNVLGTHVLLEAAKVANVQRFIHVSTDEVYGEKAYSDNVTVESVLEPTNPYAATKAAAEFIAKSYSRSFGLPVIITRGNNVYGPHQFPEKIIPKFINRLLRSKACCVHGDGSNARNFVYVKDVAKAFDAILHKGQIGKIYNVGTSFEISNLQVAKTLIDLFGLKDDEEKYIEFVADRKINDIRYAIDSSDMSSLGWSPSTSWRSGLQDTIEWYKTHQDHWENFEHALAAHPNRISTANELEITNKHTL